VHGGAGSLRAKQQLVSVPARQIKHDSQCSPAESDASQAVPPSLPLSCTAVAELACPFAFLGAHLPSLWPWPPCRYVLWSDGHHAWSAKGVPAGLRAQLSARSKKQSDVAELAKGDGGQWFVRYQDGTWHAGGLAEDCRQAADALQQQGHTIHTMCFGHGGSWAILY